MKHHTPSATRRNVRAYAAAVLSYLLLAGQMTPLVLAAKSKELRVAPPADVARERAGETVPRLEAATAPAPLAAPAAPAAVAPMITATKTDTYTGSPGPATPGTTITYTVTINNTGAGATDATNVTLTDTVDPNTTIVGTPVASPIALDETYNVLGNVQIQPNAAGGLLANEKNPNTGDNTGLTASGPVSGPSNGQATVSSDGSFTYNPNPGFTGSDSFTYTVTSANGSDTATVTLNVGNGAGGTTGGVIWFIDDSAPAGGDGRLTSPFNCYTGTSVPVTGPTCFSDTAADDPGDFIFLYAGGYTGGYTLLQNQQLIGQGASSATTLAAVTGLTVPAHSDALPALNNNPATVEITTTLPATNAVNLAAGNSNTLRGFRVGNTTGAKIASTTSGFGTLTTSEVELGGNGQALNLDSGTLAATFTSISTTSSGAQGINLDQIAGTLTAGSTNVGDPLTQCVLVTASSATFNFGNTSCTDATDGISLQNNSGSSTFGTLGVTNGSGGGFVHANGGGGVTVTGATTIVNPAGTGISIAGSNANLSFAGTTVGKNNAGTGVSLTTNTSRTITFSTLAVTTANGAGLSASGGGTVNVTNAVGSSISATTTGATAAPAIDANGVTLGANFTTLTAAGAGAGAGTGISLNNVGGSLNVSNGVSLATSVTNPGGVGISIANSAGAFSFGHTAVGGTGSTGVLLNTNTGNISFADLDILPDNNQVAFSATNHATGTISTSSGDITSNGNSAVVIDGPAGRTPLAMVLNNVDSASSTVDGLVLTDISGSFAVNDGTLATNITNPTGTGITVSNSTATVSFGNTSVTGSGNANPDDIGTGIRLVNNGGAVTFGSLTVTPDPGERGLYATDTDAASAAGAITVGTGSITTVNDIAVEITGASNTARTPLNVQLTSVSASGAAFGILLNNTNTTGSPGGFNVLGNATGSDRCGGSVTTGAVGTPATFNAAVTAECTGGTLSNITTAGVQATNVSGLSLSRMFLSNANTADGGAAGGTCDLGNVSTCNGAVDLTNVTSAALSRVNINGAEEMGVVGSNVTGFSLTNSNVQSAGNQAAEHGVGFINLFGTVSITGTRVTGSAVNHVYVLNDGAVAGSNLNMTVTGNLLTSTSNIGTDGIGIDTRGGTTSFVNIANNTLSSNKDDHVNVVSSSNAVMNVTIATNTMTGGHVAPTGQGVATRVGGPFSGTFRVDINGNSLNGAIPTAINVGLGSSEPAGTMHAFVRNNIVGTSGVNNSGSAQGSCILVEANGLGQGGVHAAPAGTLNASVTGNTLRQCFDKGIDLLGVRDGDNNLNVTVSGNNVNELDDGSSRWAIRLETGSSLLDETGTVCADILNNTLNAVTAGDEMSVRARSIATLRFPGYTGGATDTAALKAYLEARNPAGGQATASVLAPASFNNTVPAGSACAQPTAPTLPSGPVESTQNVAPGGGSPAIGGVIVAPTSSGDNVTSRPFVSPIRLVKTQAAQPVVTQQRGTAAVKAVALQTKQPKGDAAQSGTTGGGAPTGQLKKNAPATKSGGAKSGDAPTLNPPVVNGDTLTWNVGTLPAGASVTITFQVTIDNPFTGNPAQVSNQGTVTADGGVSVTTDDPSEGGANDPTVTPVLATNMFARDGTAAEPPTGTAPLVFTVALSQPATGTTTVNYATADGGATPATGGASCDGSADYISVPSTVLTFSAGQQLRTVSVDICSDGPAEPDETFLLNLSGASGATLVDNSATGTITAASPAGTTLISELRTFGPGSSNDPNDDFVEIYNNTDSQVTVAASDASAGWGVYTAATCDSAPLLLGTIPNGTVIPARGHYLLTGSAYSLANYGGTGAAAGNLTMAADLASNANVAVFSTSDITQLSTVTRLDAVGFGSNTGGAVCDLLREGATAAAVTTNLTLLGQYSVMRDTCGKGGGTTPGGPCPTTGNPKDSNSNASDFLLVDPNATNSGSGQRLGAAGPENLASPLRRDSVIGITLLDASVAAPAPPNRVRDNNPGPPNTNRDQGTLSIRRRFTNNTTDPVTRLRFRIVDISTFGPTPPSGTADLRAITAPASESVTVNDAATCGAKTPAESNPCTVTLLGTTLEQPPAQPNGGGFNSTLSAGTITTGSPLMPGASINLQFLLGVQQQGNFKFYFIIEALP